VIGVIAVDNDGGVVVPSFFSEEKRRGVLLCLLGNAKKLVFLPFFLFISCFELPRRTRREENLFFGVGGHSGHLITAFVSLFFRRNDIISFFFSHSFILSGQHIYKHDSLLHSCAPQVL
jgi:hypothetical protein